MFGMFVYKAAALVQVYRDNKDLGFEFPEEFWRKAEVAEIFILPCSADHTIIPYILKYWK